MVKPLHMLAFFLLSFCVSAKSLNEFPVDSPWIFGEVNSISYLKNKSGGIETVYGFKVKKYSNLEPSDLHNYLQFKVYQVGGIWDGVKYFYNSEPLLVDGRDIIISLGKRNGKFYLSRAHLVSAKKSELKNLLSGERVVSIEKSNQFGRLLKMNAKKRSPAQTKNTITTGDSELGLVLVFLVISLFLFVIYFTSGSES